MKFLHKLFKNNTDEILDSMNENDYYKKVPVTSLITLFNTEDIDYRIDDVLRKLEGNKLRQENTFRSKFVAMCNEQSIYTLALETTIPGYPDVQMISDNKLLLIETKCIAENEMSHIVMSKFKTTQPVFYKEYFAAHANNDNLFCLIRVGKKDKYIVFKINERFVDNIYKLHFDEIKEHVFDYMETVGIDVVIKWLKTFLK